MSKYQFVRGITGNGRYSLTRRGSVCAQEVSCELRGTGKVTERGRTYPPAAPGESDVVTESGATRCEGTAPLAEVVSLLVRPESGMPDIAIADCCRLPL
ncbi:hypothetical protein NDU88_004257 [Pleurodeles waltl]|uniref:Uncharacterized protein n=1 Tax=Pleurodeles waltl TaxID=8319 RepID=A0AAV7UGL4_PLEWA|nr:hypothetical protein NDU88_004257 [Pleurodeles waltl]